MRYVTDEYIMEVTRRRAFFWWVPERVPDCPHRACRRARKCVRPELLPYRRGLGLPSCRMIEDREWALLSESLRRILTGPRQGARKDLAAIRDEHMKALRRELKATR